MKNMLKVVLTFLGYVALFIVGYYGIKYTFVAGLTFFGPVWGTIVSIVIVVLFSLYIIKNLRGNSEL